MSISIPSELATFVDRLVASGAYPSADAVVSAALERLKQDQADFEELKQSLKEAQEELDRGECVPFNVEEILAEGRRQFAARHPESPYGSTHS
jgi:putative addiction module CopG family antidote